MKVQYIRIALIAVMVLCVLIFADGVRRMRESNRELKIFQQRTIALDYSMALNKQVQEALKRLSVQLDEMRKIQRRNEEATK